MAKGDVTFETAQGVNHAETGGPNGLLTVWADKPLTTNDPAEIAALDAFEAVVRAKKGASK